MNVPIRNIKQTFLIITSPEMVKDFLSLTLKRSMCKKQVGKKKSLKLQTISSLKQSKVILCFKKALL